MLRRGKKKKEKKEKFDLKYHIFIKYARGIFQFPTNVFQISRVHACSTIFALYVYESINSSTLLLFPPQALRFVRWISSPSGQKLVARSEANEERCTNVYERLLISVVIAGKKFTERKMCLPGRFERARKIVARPNAIRLD